MKTGGGACGIKAGMRPIPVLLLLGLLPLSAPLAAEPENAKPAEKPIDREEVQRLASQLDAEDPADREKATEALCNLGPGVVPFLLPLLESGTPEQAARIVTAVRGMGLYLARTQKNINAQLLAVQTGACKEERASAFDALLASGERGHKFLAELFAAQDAVPAIEYNFASRAVTAGKALAGSAYLANRGSLPYWIYLNEKQIFIYTRSHPEGFGEPRRSNDKLVDLQEKLRRETSKDKHLLEQVRPVLRNAREPPEDFEITLPEVGCYKIVLYAGIPVRPFSHYIHGDGCQPFSINGSQDRASEFKFPRTTAFVFALPDFEKVSSDEHLALTVASKKAGATGDDIEATVSLRSLEDQKPIYLEENLAGYAWYAVLDEKGTPVTWGSWHSVSAVAYGDRVARKLAPNAQETWALRIPTKDLSAGVYTLVAGYKADKSKFWGDTAEEMAKAKPDSYIRYQSGELGAKAAQTFTIPAKEESEAKKP